MADTAQKTAIANQATHSGKNACASCKTQPLAEELIQLEDDFTEYSEISAVLFHAFASTLSEHVIIMMGLVCAK